LGAEVDGAVGVGVTVVLLAAGGGVAVGAVLAAAGVGVGAAVTGGGGCLLMAVVVAAVAGVLEAESGDFAAKESCFIESTRDERQGRVNMRKREYEPVEVVAVQLLLWVRLLLVVAMV
jgi:hypothetical protein